MFNIFITIAFYDFFYYYRYGKRLFAGSSCSISQVYLDVSIAEEVCVEFVKFDA